MRLIVYLIILSNSAAFCQKAGNPDSLQQIWKNESERDSTRLKAYKELIWSHVIFSNPDSAFKMAQNGLDFAKEKDLKKLQADFLNTQGVASSVKGNSDKAIDLYLKSALIKEEIGDKKGLGSTFGNIGIIYQNQNNQSKAIEYFTKSLKLAEECGNKSGMAFNLINISTIYMQQKEFDKSVDYLTRSLHILESLGDFSGISTVFTNLGGVYQVKGQRQKATETYLKALEIKMKLNDRQGASIILDNLGEIYIHSGDYEKAEFYLDSALKVNETIGNKLGLAKNNINRANLFSKQLQVEKALQAAEQGYKLAQEAGSLLFMRDAAMIRYLSYNHLKDYQKALSSFTVYARLNDSIVNDASRKAVMQQEIQYNYDKQKALDEKEHIAEMKLAEERERRQKLISFGVAFSLILVAAFTFFVFNRLQLTRKQKKIIEEQKHLVEDKQKEILDSINYARRIQSALITNEHYIEKALKKLGKKSPE